MAVYDAAPDPAGLHGVWAAALGAQYPIPAPRLGHVLANPLPGQAGRHAVAHVDGAVIGFASAQINPPGAPGNPPTGWLLGIAVQPEWQRQGVGAALLQVLTADLRARGVGRLTVGGRYPRIFPGVPTDLPGAQAFFERQGFHFDQVDYDLYRRLEDYLTPDHITERVQAEGVRIGPATEADVPAVLALNDREFAGWADTYRYVASLGDYQDFLIARDAERGIVGSLIMVGPGSHPARCDTLWSALVGDNIGGLGEVGVAASERGRGLGVALVAVGSELLKGRGVGHCNIGYTSLVDFYGKLGYQVWRTYHIAHKAL
jgi:beta-N-acetylhexosaminidase